MGTSMTRGRFRPEDSETDSRTGLVLGAGGERIGEAPSLHPLPPPAERQRGSDIGFHAVSTKANPHREPSGLHVG